MQNTKEQTAAKEQRAVDFGAALIGSMTKNTEVKQIEPKAIDNISYDEFSDWKLKDLIDDN